MNTTVLEHWRGILAGVLLAAAVVSAAFFFWPRPAPALVVITPSPRPTASPPPALAIHVVGAVARPGVYQLPAGSRADDAVAEAGGLTDEADPGSLNLAARLVDGQQVAVRPRAPSPTERVAVPAAEAKPAGRLNINQASAADLDALPGVGPVLAQRIVDRRQRLGPFQSIEQLRDEKLLPVPTFDRIKDLIAVS